MSSLRKNVASQNITFQLTAKADGTPVTAGGAGNVSKDGGAQASCAGTFTHLGTGQWNYAPTQGETNAAAVGFQFTGTGAITLNMHFFTDNWDTSQPVVTSGTGTDQLQVASGIASADVKKWNGTTVATPATAGVPDINVKNINNVAAATPGASGGILIAGTNAATTFTSASGDALVISSTGSNGNGINVSGNGTGAGIKSTGGGTGNALQLIGGGTSGAGVSVTTTSGDGIAVSPTAGNGLTLTANGTSKHGLVSTGGTGGTSDGIKGVAGTGGVDIRGNLTGNIHGTLDTLTTYTGNTPQTGDVFGQLPSHFSALGITAAGKVSEVVLTDTLTTYTGNTPQTGDAFALIGTAGVGLTNLGDSRIANLDAVVSSRATAASILTTGLTESYAVLHAAPTLSQAIFEMLSLQKEKAVSGTTLTAKKIDGSTTAATYTLSDAVSPTSITRAS
jgi:hypothetical protein